MYEAMKSFVVVVVVVLAIVETSYICNPPIHTPRHQDHLQPKVPAGLSWLSISQGSSALPADHPRGDQSVLQH